MIEGDAGAVDDSESEQLYYQHKVKMEEVEVQPQNFVEQLGLNELIAIHRSPNNTKNVLRNIGNAQNQYILYHQEAKAWI